ATAASRALLALADARAEAFSAVPVPEFPLGDSARMTLAVQRWIGALQGALRQAIDAYRRVLDDPQLVALAPEGSIAVAARTGQLYARFAATTLTIPIPTSVFDKGDDAVDAYCDTLATYADPLNETALAAWTACVQDAGALGVTGRWPALCAEEYARRRPGGVPPP
ncbi:MAG: hypothetical protein KC464_03050, partial [Myxococcales bacterium]|nr:hypothetical protein [Myxococcales bacterium]